MWLLTCDTWHMILFFLCDWKVKKSANKWIKCSQKWRKVSTGRISLYWCYYPYTPRELASPVWRIFFKVFFRQPAFLIGQLWSHDHFPGLSLVKCTIEQNWVHPHNSVCVNPLNVDPWCTLNWPPLACYSATRGKILVHPHNSPCVDALYFEPWCTLNQTRNML